MTQTVAERDVRRYGHLSLEAIQNGDALQKKRALRERRAASDFLEELFGRLVEIVGKEPSAGLTAGMGLVRDAQRKRETSLWLTDPKSLFFPPDAADFGVDLDLLPIVRAPLESLFSTADKIIRSGGFGLVLVDLTTSAVSPCSPQNDGILSRLLGSAQKHDTAVVFLTRQAGDRSLGSLISLRVEASRTRSASGLIEVTLTTVKDKRRPPGRRPVSEVCLEPAGLC